MSTSLEAEEITEEQIDQMTPKTLRAKNRGAQGTREGEGGGESKK